MKDKVKPICIIPARKGSKRIKNKNIIKFFGKPLIYYSINAALKSKIFSKVIVSTDSIKIKKISERYGAQVPFLRKKNLSDDLTSTKDVLIDTIKKINSLNSEFHCLLYPTAPLVKPETLKKAYKKLVLENADGLMTVTKYLNHPLRSLILKKKYLEFKWKKFQKKNSQDLEELFHDCGNFYFFRTSKILNRKNFYPKKIIPFYQKIYNSVDIDNYDDLILAKKLFKK
ncbi:MAG: pseudaminic acid cytidylyltransferase [Acidimicrobiaceae bacterium]|nr:pseudaminic acid cytidylyltransferase [Acidimicrobiaceae bacterium]|tara:strand:+ start:4925 stop:5608 length:684 start_codon:yes stop_codon:yes gene_type:complete